MTSLRSVPHSTRAAALQRLIFGVGLLLLAGCGSNADQLYQAEVFARQEAERNSGLPDQRRVEVRDPVTKETTEIRQLVRTEDGYEVSDGRQWEYWPDGSVRSLRSYFRGEPQGLWWSWWRTGALRSAYVHNPAEPTRMTWWHPNGAVAAEGMAHNGRRIGEWSYFHENGALESRGEMSGGFRIGPWTFYDTSGEWTERGDYVLGKRALGWEFRARAGAALFGR